MESKDNVKVAEDDFALLSKLAEERSKIYGFLSMFYLEKPREELVIKLRDHDFLENLHKVASQVKGELREGLEAIEIFLKSTKDVPEEKIVEELAVDFTKLFRGLKPGYGPPPPYESVYRDEGRVMGASTLGVMKKYADAGRGVGDEYGPPDYIGTELKFMSLLCSREAEAWRKRDRDQALRFLEMEMKFMDEHLRKWIPKFCELMEKEATSDFYRGVSRLTDRFLIFDREQINSTLEFGKAASEVK